MSSPFGASFGIDTSASGLANTAEQLSNYLDPEDTHAAISAIQNLPDGAVGAVQSIVSTGKVNLTTAGPLIAAGLAATGVGAPAAAVVAAALPIASAIGNALGLFGGGKDEHYDYYVKSPGVTMSPADTNPNGFGRNGHVPYGPGDPAWETADRFLPQDMQDTSDGYYPPPPVLRAEGIVLNGGGNHSYDMLKAFPEWGLISNDLKTLDKRAMSPGMRQFFRAFYGAWKANAEKLWNGHKGVAPSTLLAVTATAWNRSHGTDRTESITPVTSWDTFRGDHSSDPTFINVLLGGLVDGADEPPLTLNMGAAAPAMPARKIIIPLHFPPPPKKVIGHDDMKTSPNELAPAMYYVTGVKYATNDPKLMPAVAAARIAGVDPSRWARLTDEQRNFLTDTGFTVAARKGLLDGLAREVKSSTVGHTSRIGLVIFGLAAIVAAYLYKRSK